jgi:hypothetical protein
MNMPVRGASIAMTISDKAAALETNVRDQTISCSSAGMTKLNVARPEKARARTRKPRPATSHGTSLGGVKIDVMAFLD